MVPVLVADDDGDIRDALSWLLREEGYAPVEAASAADALALIDARAFALILTDLFSHGRDSAASGIRGLVERAYPTPVGLLSAWPLSDDEIAASRCAFFLGKPFDIDNLLTTIAAALHMALTPDQQGQAEQVRRYFAALSTRDWDALVDLCTDDAVYVLPGGGPFSQTLRGKAAFRAYSEETFRHFPAARFEAIGVYATPQGLAARYESTWQGADGGEQRQAGSVLFQFDGGRIRQIGVRLNDARLRALIASEPDAEAHAIGSA
jgi:ketosteroid isomerase-like protein/CheY-like chemotaxis protein